MLQQNSRRQVEQNSPSCEDTRNFNVVSLPLLWAPSEPVPLLFFIFNLFFSWRNISVQCRVGICQTTTQLSYNCTYIPTLFNLPSLPHLTPLGYQEHQAGLLVLCNIYLTHDSAYMSVPLSQFITLSFPCCVYESVLCICISIPFLEIGTSVPFF